MHVLPCTGYSLLPLINLDVRRYVCKHRESRMIWSRFQVRPSLRQVDALRTEGGRRKEANSQDCQLFIFLFRAPFAYVRGRGWRKGTEDSRASFILSAPCRCNLRLKKSFHQLHIPCIQHGGIVQRLPPVLLQRRGRPGGKVRRKIFCKTRLESEKFRSHFFKCEISTPGVESCMGQG